MTTLRGKQAALALLAALVTACGDDEPGGDRDAGNDAAPSLDAATGPEDGAADAATDAHVDRDAGPAIEALFVLPESDPSGEYYTLPFPNDLRVRADGTLDLDGITGNAFVENALATASTHFAGFGGSSPVFVRFSGAIDVASLPPTSADTVADDAAVYLVDVDPGSPDRGSRVPLRIRFQAEPGALIGGDSLRCAPVPGFALRERTTYALVATDRLSGEGGAIVQPSADFAAVMGDAATADERVLGARLAYGPLRDWLDEAGGDERADVVDAAVFTVGDLTGGVGGLRAAVYDLSPPVVAQVVQTDETATLTQFEGTYAAPNFQTGTVPYLNSGGEILFDQDGHAIVQRTEDLRFAVTVPLGPVPGGGWPVVLFAHGSGGDFRSFLADGVADVLAQQGLAVVGIDQVLHGARNPGGDPITQFSPPGNWVAGRDNIRQSAADDFFLLRLIEGASIDGDDGRTHTFDPDRIAFMGHSLGGITGSLFVAYEQNVTAAVLSSPGALISITSLQRTEDINVAVLLALILGEESVDEFNNFVALQQMFIDPADPVNFGALWAERPPVGNLAKDIFEAEGIEDPYSVPDATEALAVAAGLSAVDPVLHDNEGFALRGIASPVAPVTANGPDGATTVLVQYPYGHFALFDLPEGQQQYAEFLGSRARTGRATLVAP